MKWKLPPKVKVYEALGAIADERVEISGNQAKVFSSSGGKYYEVVYDPQTKQIAANDNGSYWRGYLGYPAIAFLMLNGLLAFDEKLAQLLRGIKWKDINQSFENDFAKTENYLAEFVTKNGGDFRQHSDFADKIMTSLDRLTLGKPSILKKPPTGY
ncbi:MAG: hypothetical protein AAB364_02045 [Patescibacteria group bacterium]